MVWDFYHTIFNVILLKKKKNSEYLVLRLCPEKQLPRWTERPAAVWPCCSARTRRRSPEEWSHSWVWETVSDRPVCVLPPNHDFTSWMCQRPASCLHVSHLCVLEADTWLQPPCRNMESHDAPQSGWDKMTTNLRKNPKNTNSISASAPCLGQHQCHSHLYFSQRKGDRADSV